jgi:hypothetical protein
VGHHDERHGHQPGTATQGLALDAALVTSHSHRTVGSHLVEIDIGSFGPEGLVVAKVRRNRSEIEIIQAVGHGYQVRNTDFHEAQPRGALGGCNWGILRGSLGRWQLEAHPRSINLSRYISPTGLDAYLRIATQKLDRSPGSTAGAIGAENCLAPIGVSVAEADPVSPDALERKRTVGSDSAPPVTQPSHESGLAIEAPGPGPNTKHEIVAGAFELVKR